ncbi:hypothetical protein BaRGS_00004183 [Batillaria attramentaria]|uniref:Uncharacterized protein n=1 Tax=Batillaria attramentaria TaxID=370345 RepID=A0ABD0LZ47_9CAEN
MGREANWRTERKSWRSSIQSNSLRRRQPKTARFTYSTGKQMKRSAGARKCHAPTTAHGILRLAKATASLELRKTPSSEDMRS